MVKKSRKMAPLPNAGETANTSEPGNVSSPTSTGGAGVFFEQHVGAYWLAQLLVQGIPPILHDCVVVEVHLQTEHLGWCTDDFLIVGQKGSGDRRKLVGQVKRTFTVSVADEECKKAIRDFWKDFRNSQQFSPETDRFTLVVLRGSNTLLEHFLGLLDCSRAVPGKAEFERRLAIPGFVSAKAVQYYNTLRAILEEYEGRSVDAAEVWPPRARIEVPSSRSSATTPAKGLILSLRSLTTVRTGTRIRELTRISLSRRSR
jgi:hypothetical protein